MANDPSTVADPAADPLESQTPPSSTQPQTKMEGEAQYFSDTNNRATRQVGWNRKGFFRRELRERLELASAAKDALGARDTVRALTLGCGDMTGEWGFLNTVGTTQIVAYDVSEGQRDKFFERIKDTDYSVEIDYRIGDVSQVDLGTDEFDLVLIQQSYHHFEEVELIAAAVRRALRPDGVFVLHDYVGEPFLQRGPKQRDVAERVWKNLPDRLRLGANGEVFSDLHVPPKEMLSPNEAIRSLAILPAIRENFDVIDEHIYGGLVFAVLNGFSQNYTSEEDETLMRVLWEMDDVLTRSGGIEPNFIRALYRPKP